MPTRFNYFRFVFVFNLYIEMLYIKQNLKKITTCFYLKIYIKFLMHLPYHHHELQICIWLRLFKSCIWSATSRWHGLCVGQAVGRSVTLPCANRSSCYNCIYIHIIHAHTCTKPKLVYIHRENLNKLPSENVVFDVPIPVQFKASSLTMPWKRGRLRSFFAKKKIVRLNSLAPNHTAPLQTVGI